MTRLEYPSKTSSLHRNAAHKKVRKKLAILLAGLLAATSLTPGVIAADDASSSKSETESATLSTEARLARLEAILGRIMDRLDAHEDALSVTEVKVVEAARAAVAEAKSETTTTTAAANPVINTATTGFQMGDTAITIGGYTKLDLIASRFSDATPTSSNIGRDFYIPALVPVQAGNFDGNWVTDFNIRETRLKLNTSTPVGDDKLITSVEVDFQVTPGGDERISNSYLPRVRNAYIKYKGFTLGQTWSTFQDVAALPDNLDFVGPAEGTTFERQPLIRYQTGPFEIAIEQPETAFTTQAGGRVLSGSDPLPDVVGRFTQKGDWGHLKVAAIVRDLNKEAVLSPADVEDSELGYGVSVSGKLKFGLDDFRFMATAGEGLGRYIGLNLVNGAAITDEGELQAIASYSGFASYRHFWTDKMRSNLTLGYFKADNPTRFTTENVTDEAMSLHANLIYTPIKRFDVGIEYILARRELENGLRGYLNRIQFSTKFSF